MSVSPSSLRWSRRRPGSLVVASLVDATVVVATLLGAACAPASSSSTGAAARPAATAAIVRGADAANGLDTWRSAEELKASAHFAIVTRPRHNVSVPPGFSFQLVEGTPPDISSTAIRAAVAAGATAHDLQQLVSPEVAEYISATGLYR